MGGVADVVRVRALVSGQVQGVGFRWWTRARALELGLAGHAKNLDDGRVEVDAEGPEPDLDALVTALRSGGTPGRVEEVVTSTLTPTGRHGFTER
ncbi:acylphosphatase [Jatrophihabitans sp. YIM 134969]